MNGSAFAEQEKVIITVINSQRLTITAIRKVAPRYRLYVSALLLALMMNTFYNSFRQPFGS